MNLEETYDSHINQPFELPLHSRYLPDASRQVQEYLYSLCS